LDEPSLATPDVHIFTRSKVPWLKLPDGTPAFETHYDSRKIWPAASLARLDVITELRAERDSG
jgi:hypothetical protein